MIMECLGAIQWDHPAIFGPVVAAITAGIFLIVTALINRNKPSSPTVNVVLPEKDVGQELSKALDPHSARIEARIDALSEQMVAQLAPKQKVPDSGDPLKIKAVEFYNAGVDADNEGEIGRATGHWLDAIKLDPGFAYAHYNLGVGLKDKGDLNAAIEHWRTALRINPNLTEAHCNLGAALIAKGELDVAIEHFNAALRIEPDDAPVHFNLGCVLAQKKDAAAAVTALAKAIELDPTFRDKAKHEADFDPIRDDPAFRKLVDGE